RPSAPHLSETPCPKGSLTPRQRWRDHLTPCPGERPRPFGLFATIGRAFWRGCSALKSDEFFIVFLRSCPSGDGRPPTCPVSLTSSSSPCCASLRLVANALRQTLPEFLMAAAKSDSLTKFIAERQDTENMRSFRLAS